MDFGLIKAEFDPLRFNFGADWEFASKNGRMEELKDALDYVTIWCNEPTFNIYWQGEMINYCKKYNKTPVFYGYLIAKLSGLGDSDVGGQLDQQGGGWLRSNINRVIQAYEGYAQKIAETYGIGKPVIWLMEPDYYQYCNGYGNDISVSDAANYMSQIINAIKKYLPNAFFSLDISPWNNNQDSYIKTFNLKLFSFMHTSGGRTEAASDRIRYDNNNNVTWGQVNSASGLCIIADDGYGFGGVAQGHAADWDDVNNIKNRMRNGVVAVTQKDPKAGWAATIISLKNALKNEATKCSGLKFQKKYTLTVTATSGGKVTKTPDAVYYDSGTVVTLTAVPNAGYKLKNWSGDVTDTSRSVTVIMNGDKSVTAVFVDINAKPQFTLTITSSGSGVVDVSPKQAEYDSGTVVTLIAYTVGGATFNGWGGALAGVKDQVTTLVIDGNKTVSASFSGNNISLTNLIKNGDFSDGTNNWTFGAYQGAQAEGVVSEGGFKVTVQKAGTEDWHIQLYQGKIKLQKGVKYSLSFTAFSEADVSIVANVGLGVEPYTSFLQKRVNLTPTQEVFTFTFTMKDETVSDARLEFNAGKAASGWTIKNVSLTEAIELDPLASLPGFGQKSFHLTYANRRIFFTLYDHAGRLVRHTSGEYGTLLKRMSATICPGSYIAVIEAGKERSGCRKIIIGR